MWKIIDVVENESESIRLFYFAVSISRLQVLSIALSHINIKRNSWTSSADALDCLTLGAISSCQASWGNVGQRSPVELSCGLSCRPLLTVFLLVNTLARQPGFGVPLDTHQGKLHEGLLTGWWAGNNCTHCVICATTCTSYWAIPRKCCYCSISLSVCLCTYVGVLATTYIIIASVHLVTCDSIWAKVNLSRVH